MIERIEKLRMVLDLSHGGRRTIAEAVNDAYRKAHAEFVVRRKKLGIVSPGEAEDVFNFVPELNEPRRMERLAELLARRGFAERRVLEILGGNLAPAFGEVWG